jgi:hypothetical protein
LRRRAARLAARTAAKLAGLAGLVIAVAATPALGCGHCVEDRIAAVYDHGAIARALEQHHRIAFFSIEGPLTAGKEPQRAIAGALRSMKGVDAASLRVSAESAALSLSYDGKLTSSNRIADVLNRKLAAHGLSVSTIELDAKPQRQ